jgi:Xaa-Pro aminopeptidase
MDIKVRDSAVIDSFEHSALLIQTSFTGSAGLAIVSKTTAYLITDSRYWLQAERELDENWRLIRSGTELGPRNWVDWMAVRAPFSILRIFAIDAPFLFPALQDRVNESRVGVDARMISNETAQQLYPLLQAKKSKLVYPSQNLIDLIWVNKPVRSKNKIFVQPIEYTGESNT